MLREIKNREEWNEMVLKNSPRSGGFLGSWEWGEFQERVGRSVRRFANGNQWAQAIEHTLPFGKKYWFIARGSVFANQKGAQGSSLGSGFPVPKDGLSTNKYYNTPNNLVKFTERPGVGPQGNRTPQGWLTIHPGSPDRGPNTTDPLIFYHELLMTAKEQDTLFIRIEPDFGSEIPSDAQETIHVSPPTTLIIDLTKSEDELLSAMHEKTRYNIRLAERKNVKCQNSNAKQLDVFWNLLEETARRDGFRTHGRSYYERMLEIPWVELWTAEWDGKVLAAGLWACFGDTVTYLHGASSSEHRNVMAPFLLHWEVIRDVKRRGFKAYDFWGIASTTYNLQPTTSWSGMTRFKTGFGGEVVEYSGTLDLPISKFWYRIYKIARKVRRI